jgi:hypothetical protein
MLASSSMSAKAAANGSSHCRAIVAYFALTARCQTRHRQAANRTNTMGQNGQDFEKGEADGTADALAVLDAIVNTQVR